MFAVETIQRIAKCLNMPVQKLQLNDEQIVTCSLNDKIVTGFATILNQMSKYSSNAIAINSCKSREIEAQVYQWIEYSMLYVAAGSKDKYIRQQLLKDFNKLFLNKSYLVGYNLTLADLAVFYAIYELMKSLTPLDKEAYVNLSRWFDHLQQRSDIRQDKDVLHFTTIFL